MKMELRVNPTSIVTNEDGTMTVSGYVNKTNQESRMLGKTQKFKEVIKRGAWQRAIENAEEIHFLAEHDHNKILSSTRNGSLELREDDEGLYMSATISPTSWGKDYYQLIKDGILQNMSFGFRAVKDAWRNMGTHFERTVDELQLFEVSVVRDPAYSSSTISARGIDLVEDEVPQSEVNLRSIEIRSDEDIQAIAQKLFEMLQASTKIAEGQDPKDEPDEPADPIDPVDPEVTDPEVTDPDPNETTNPVDTEEEPADPIENEVEDPDKTETKDEEVEDKKADLSNVDKLREYINAQKN